LEEQHLNLTLPFLGAIRPTTQNGSSTASTVASQYYSDTTDRPTDRQTKPVTCSVSVGRLRDTA